MNSSRNRHTHGRSLPPGVRFQRLTLVFFSVACFVVGLAVLFLPGLENTSRQYTSGTLMKVGVVLGLVWLAAPQLERLGWQRLRGTMLVALIVVLVLWAIRPRLGALAGAALIVGSLFFSLIGWFRRLK